MTSYRASEPSCSSSFSLLQGGLAWSRVEAYRGLHPGVEVQLTSAFSLLPGVGPANKHKPWIEAEYQGIVMENDNTVLLNPPLFALDKDAPLRYAGNWGYSGGIEKGGWEGRRQESERDGRSS